MEALALPLRSTLALGHFVRPQAEFGVEVGVEVVGVEVDFEVEVATETEVEAETEVWTEVEVGVEAEAEVERPQVFPGRKSLGMRVPRQGPSTSAHACESLPIPLCCRSEPIIYAMTWRFSVGYTIPYSSYIAWDFSQLTNHNLMASNFCWLIMINGSLG